MIAKTTLHNRKGQSSKWPNIVEGCVLFGTGWDGGGWVRGEWGGGT